MEGLVGVYRPRQPKLSQFYRCIEDNFEQFERIYPERYEREYDFWRPVVREVILKYLVSRKFSCHVMPDLIRHPVLISP